MANEQTPDENSGSQNAGGNKQNVLSHMPDQVFKVTTANSNAVMEAPLPPVQKAGYKLAKFILWIISGYLVLLFIMLFTKDFDGSNEIRIVASNVPDSVFQKQIELIEAYQEEQQSNRDFIYNISQMVLLNLLLPTLTAVLGYIFGTREGRNAGGEIESTG